MSHWYHILTEYHSKCDLKNMCENVKLKAEWICSVFIFYFRASALIKGLIPELVYLPRRRTEK